MASTIDIFNSVKVELSKLTGSNNFFNSIGEITESQRSNNRYITNTYYADPSAFARFGSAEEYYKNAINYINTEYPYDGSLSKKLKWKNELNELEYYIFENEYPRYKGYINLSSSQYVAIYSPSQDSSSYNERDESVVKYNNKTFFVDKILSFNNGFTYEAWAKFNNTSSVHQLLNINTVNSSSSNQLFNVTLFKAYVSSSLLFVSGTNNSASFNYDIPTNEWHHYAVTVNNNSASLFVDGTIKSSISSNSIYDSGFLTSSYSFRKLGLISTDVTSSITATGSYTKIPSFIVGSGSSISFDELRFWNLQRPVEKIGSFWFSKIDGNDFNDPFNDDLIFYYKFNEGLDAISGSFVLDYSGYLNDALIINYTTASCRVSGSGIDSSGLVQDIEPSDAIIATPISSSTTLANFFNYKSAIGAEYDEDNQHALYKKFPSWLLEQEEENDIKHLKQVIQIISSYFDDLYNKISEIPKYKHLQFLDDNQEKYPFYDKILTSTGFDVTEIFNNLNYIEKVLSRTEKNIFDENIVKIKNTIFQNIYNNLSFILKSKGTEKSLKSFLRSYGLNENLVKINLYADKSQYTISDKYSETTVRKKTITFNGDQSIFLSSSAVQLPTNVTGNYFTLESSVIFPKNLSSQNVATGSIMGIFLAPTSNSFVKDNSKLQAYVTIESGTLGHTFCFRTGSAGALVGSSSVFTNLYDDSTWNLAIGFYPNVDDILTGQNYNFIIDFRAVNLTKENTPNFTISGSCPPPVGDSFYSGYGRYFIGAKRTNLTGSVIEKSYSKFLYSNFWATYLSDNELEAHNRDILNYGIE